MQRFCDDLRLERERRNISLQTIGKVTRVPPRHLQALESGNFSELPGGVFRKGILRNYLSVLGVDEGPWIERFEAALASSGAPVEKPVDLADLAEKVERTRPVKPRRPDLRWIGVAFMASTVVLLGWCVWHYAFRGHIVLSLFSSETLPR